MGAICSVCVRNSAVDKSPSDTTLGANTIRDIDFTNKNQPKLSSEYVETQFQEELVLSSDMLTPSSLSTPSNANLSDGIPRLSRTFSQNSTLGRRATTTKAGTKACICYYVFENYFFLVLDFLVQCCNIILRNCNLYFIHGFHRWRWK